MAISRKFANFTTNSHRRVNKVGSSPQTYNDVVLADSPVAFWSFDEIASQRGLGDKTDYGRGGAFTSASVVRTAQTALPGLGGKYIDGASANFRASPGDSSWADSLTTTLAIECWLKWTTNAIMQLCIRDALSGSARQWQFRTNGNNVQVIFFIPNSSTVVSATGTSAIRNDGNWHYVVGQYTGSAVELWVDNTKEGNTAASGSINPGTGEAITIGSDSSGAGAFNGQLDALAIYSAPLTTTQMAARMAARL